MPSSQKKSHGPIVQARVRQVLKGILEATKVGEISDSKKLQFRWQDEAAGSQKVTIETTLQALMHVTNQDGQATVTTANVREALEAMRDFLGILHDHRVKTKGEAQWDFTLTLSSTHISRNLEAFDKLWESKRSPKSKLQALPEQSPKSGLKVGAPSLGVRLPENYVPRPKAFDAVKQKLLATDDRALVVSAIAGLGGLGKSVLATALVLDAEVQTRFADGILWVTLGQNPDLQNLLGDWIRTLDKSRESYSATTLEWASSYLRTVLLEKRMLLVVDDVWNGAHVEHFRVGGAACRVLVTTREAQIEGAEYHLLDLMSEVEAIELVRQKLKRQWKPEQESEVKAFAKSLGYLPLALDLAANQVRDGLSWGELRSEFETERRSVALEVLDSSEAWDCLDENQQRKYSLRACFNLSLRRLSAEQLRQFAWLGVLPEDVSLDVRMAVTLWELSPLKAKKALIALRNRSFLTSGTETLEGELTYRVHDLMHDTARGLIEQATLSAPIRTLADAHAQFLDRYRQKCDRWDRLPNDGYIHRHLTWHLQQAGREDEIHVLMAMSDEQGRNAWFEACDRLGQPAIFVQDVKRGWQIAEESYEQDNTRSIVLQCRYALITATLNSLVGNLPIGMMAEFVKRKYWTPEQAWAYVEQMQDEENIVEAIEKLASYLPKAIFGFAVKKTRSLRNESNIAMALTALTQVDSAYLLEAVRVARSIRDVRDRARSLNKLAQIDSVYLPETIEVSRSIQDECHRASALSDLAKIDNSYFEEALDAVRSVQNASARATALCTLAKINNAYFEEALDAVRSIQHPFFHSEVMDTLAEIDHTYLSAETARSLQDEYWRAMILTALAKTDSTHFTEALTTARTIRNKHESAVALSVLAKIDPAYFAEALAAFLAIEKERLIEPWNMRKVKILSILAEVNTADIARLLDVAFSIHDEDKQARALFKLVRIDRAYLAEASDAARSIRMQFDRARALSILARIDRAYFAEALDAARLIQDKSDRARALSVLARIDRTYSMEALNTARLIQDESDRAGILSTFLAQIDEICFAEALSVARSQQNNYNRTLRLIDLAEIDETYFAEALSAASLLRMSKPLHGLKSQTVPLHCVI